ncbi:hypothetical protein ACFLYT_01625 [Nanoarchaeota archaeon]
MDMEYFYPLKELIPEFDGKIVRTKEISDKIREGQISRASKGLEENLIAIDLGHEGDISDSRGALFRFRKVNRGYSCTVEETLTSEFLKDPLTRLTSSRRTKDEWLKKISYSMPVPAEEFMKIASVFYTELLFSTVYFPHHDDKSFYRTAKLFLSDSFDPFKYTFNTGSENQLKLTLHSNKGKTELRLECNNPHHFWQYPFIMSKVETLLGKLGFNYEKTLVKYKEPIPAE